MSDDLRTLRADIGFLRELAQEGRAAAPAGGPVLVAAGVIYGLAAVIHWLALTSRIPTADWTFPVIWLAATAVFLLALFALKRRGEEELGAAARAGAVAWKGVGWSILAISLCMAVVSWRAHSTVPTLLFPPLILTLYGLGWMVAGAVCRQRWIGATAVAAYVLAVVNAWFSTTEEGMLVYAASLALLAIAPGLALMRAARAA